MSVKYTSFFKYIEKYQNCKNAKTRYFVFLPYLVYFTLIFELMQYLKETKFFSCGNKQMDARIL